MYVVLGGYSTARWLPNGQYLDKNPRIGDGHVFKSTDGGETFTDISGNLPDVVTTAVALRGTQLIVGTDIGVFISNDLEGHHWAPLGDLPNVPVNQLVLKPGDPSKLFAGTFGRGVQLYDFAKVTAADPLTVSLSAQCGAAACAADTVYEVSESAPLTVSFTAAAAGGSGNGRQYTFYFGDGTQSPAQAGSTVTHDYKYANADGYHARVVVTEDGASSGATSADVVIKTRSTVTVEPQPDSTAAALEVSPDSGAVPLTVTADASGSTHATGTASTEYAFDFGDGTVVAGDADTATHVYTVAGTYTVELTVTDKDGDGGTLGTSSMSRQVSAGSGNQLTALLSVSPSKVKVGETVTFDGCHSFAADGQEIRSFTFDPDGDGSIAAVTQSVSSPVSCDAGHEDASVYRFIYSAPGAYVPTLTVTDDTGQSKSVQAKVAVVPAAASGGGGGGGGALGLALLLPLLGLGLARRRPTWISGAAGSGVLLLLFPQHRRRDNSRLPGFGARGLGRWGMG